MIDGLLRFSIARRWVVLFLVLAIGALGAWNYQRLPIDAVPDITNVQVQINTSAPGYSPLEVEQRITYLVETAIAGLPNLEYTRSLSRYGLSQVTVIFHDGTDIYWARNLISERLQQVASQLPEGIEPSMGPIATGLGEIFLYTVHADPKALQANGQPWDATALRTLQDWVIRPQLRGVPGVTEVNTIGGFEKQFHVTPDPARLLAYGLSFHDVVQAIEKNNASVGAGYIEKNGEQYLIRSPGQVADIAAIERITVARRDGVPITVRDVADVAFGKQLRPGAAPRAGELVDGGGGGVAVVGRPKRDLDLRRRRGARGGVGHGGGGGRRRGRRRRCRRDAWSGRGGGAGILDDAERAVFAEERTGTCEAFPGHDVGPERCVVGHLDRTVHDAALGRREGLGEDVAAVTRRTLLRGDSQRRVAAVAAFAGDDDGLASLLRLG